MLPWTETAAKALTLDETAGLPGEFGFRPHEGATVRETPPGFVWRPQKDAQDYELQCARDSTFSSIVYRADALLFNVHRPSEVFESGQWYWRFRFRDRSSGHSRWSATRRFTVPDDAAPFPLPSREELLARIPEGHPRLFIRPEHLTELREKAKGVLEKSYTDLVAISERLLNKPPPVNEPPLYSGDMKRGSDEWRTIWWGNRGRTIRALEGAATLGFAWRLSGDDRYGKLAQRLLMECMKWNPTGSTGYRYNDEAGMPFIYNASRAYTFCHDLLSGEERETCRRIMRIRSAEMYEHLFPRHLWHPYASHSNRAWHFLGEAGIAFLHEIPEAADWVWFAMNVFSCVYPVWSGDDGGWHEGLDYWRSYMERFTWWADIMDAAMDVNAFERPFFLQTGYYPVYVQPPGTERGGFGDLAYRHSSDRNCELLSILAAQTRNHHWQWYVEAHNKPAGNRGYIGFIRDSKPPVKAKPPIDLPSSRCFRGVGQAYLNSNLLDATKNIEILFKSSPFGSQSHGYDAQNSFQIYAFGKPLFISTGRRDNYGSPHHRNWMWQTKSTNCITVNGTGQIPHSPEATGRIVDFHTSERFDYVTGDAATAYGGRLTRFKRRILFIKPELIVVYDTLSAREPSLFEWHLHSPVKMSIAGQHDIRVVTDDAACRVDFLWPENLVLRQSDSFDPPPRERIQLTEYHLTAGTLLPVEARFFITVFRIGRHDDFDDDTTELKEIEGGFQVTAPLSGGAHADIYIDRGTSSPVSTSDFFSDGEFSVVITDPREKKQHLSPKTGVKIIP
jgi:hypothetical protein